MKTYVFSKEVALIVVEAIQGEGGNIVPPPGYHKRLKALAERHDKKIRDLRLRKCFENGRRVIRFFVFITGTAA
jgi:cell division protein ZapA (FtsZ GTPase activity inhibitor)